MTPRDGARPPLNAQEEVRVLSDLMDLFGGTGAHLGHVREQVGRCVHCSCGSRYQGRL